MTVPPSGLPPLRPADLHAASDGPLALAAHGFRFFGILRNACSCAHAPPASTFAPVGEEQLQQKPPPAKRAKQAKTPPG